MLYEWGNNIYTALNNNKIFPKDCVTQKFIIQNHYPYEHEAFYSLIRGNHCNNFTDNIYLIDAPPTQLKVGDPLSKYFHR